jgi:hypothetical protein
MPFRNKDIDYDIPTYLRWRRGETALPTEKPKTLTPPPSAALPDDIDEPTYYRWRKHLPDQEPVPNQKLQVETTPLSATPETPTHLSEPVSSFAQLHELYQQEQVIGLQLVDLKGNVFSLQDIQLDNEPRLRGRIKGNHINSSGKLEQVRFNPFREDGSLPEHGPYREIRLILREAIAGGQT